MVDVAYFAVGAGSFAAYSVLYLIAKGLFLEIPYRDRKFLGENPRRSDLIIDGVASALPFPFDRLYALNKRRRERKIPLDDRM